MSGLRWKSLLFLISLLVLNSCKDFKEAEVTGVKGFKIKSLNTEGIEAEVILGVKNPNSIGFSIYPSEFDISFSGVNLGKAKLKKRVHIDANCEKPYVFELKSTFKDLNLLDLTKLLSGSKLGLMEVKGDLKAGKFWLKKSFPVNHKEKIGLGS